MNTSNGSENVEQFIRYLYEYESDRPIRNVGFVKVETAVQRFIYMGRDSGWEKRLH